MVRERVWRPILVVWVTRLVCNTDKETISEFGNAIAPEVVEVESETALFLKQFFSALGNSYL